MTRQLVHEIQTSRSGISHNISIKIDEEGDINYEVFWDYMASKMNTAYVEKDSAENHLKAIRSNTIITADIVDSNGKVNCMVHQ